MSTSRPVTAAAPVTGLARVVALVAWLVLGHALFGYPAVLDNPWDSCGQGSCADAAVRVERTRQLSCQLLWWGAVLVLATVTVGCLRWRQSRSEGTAPGAGSRLRQPVVFVVGLLWSVGLLVLPVAFFFTN